MPSPNNGYSTLADVVAIASDDIWASVSTHAGRHTQALFEHWDGNNWSIVPPADRNPYKSYLRPRCHFV